MLVASRSMSLRGYTVEVSRTLKPLREGKPVTDMTADSTRNDEFPRIIERRVRAHDELLAPHGNEIGSRFDQKFLNNPHVLSGSLATPRAGNATGIPIEPMTPEDTFRLWLDTAFDGDCPLSMDPTLHTGVVASIVCSCASAMVNSDSVTHFARRRWDETTAEFNLPAC